MAAAFPDVVRSALDAADEPAMAPAPRPARRDGGRAASSSPRPSMSWVGAACRCCRICAPPAPADGRRGRSHRGRRGRLPGARPGLAGPSVRPRPSPEPSRRAVPRTATAGEAGVVEVDVVVRRVRGDRRRGTPGRGRRRSPQPAVGARAVVPRVQLAALRELEEGDHDPAVVAGVPMWMCAAVRPCRPGRTRCRSRPGRRRRRSGPTPCHGRRGRRPAPRSSRAGRPAAGSSSTPRRPPRAQQHGPR